MSIIDKLFGTRCSFCKQKTSAARLYLSRDGQRIKVCPKCTAQAERMVLKRL